MLKSLKAIIALPGILTCAVGGTAAAQNETNCSPETLRGQYLFATSGTLYPPAFGVTEVSQSTSAGYDIYNGDGTGTSVVTFRVNGITVPVASPTPITYTLGQDCTGTLTVQPSGPDFNIFVAVNGEAVTLIATDPGFGVSEGPDRRVRASR